jgi:iron complex outermembrane receptor protein
MAIVIEARLSAVSALTPASTWRAGLVYNVTPQITPYLSFTTGEDPVGSNIFTVNSNEDFDLGKSRQVEAGVKAETADKRASMTIAIYDIKRENILQAVSPILSVPVGSETSRGMEASADVRLTDTWTVNANTAYNDAKYGQFAYVDGAGTLVNASGNTIPNAPKWISNVWTNVTNVAGLPLELGAGVRYVGERTGDDANTLTLKSYTTLNLYATWSVTPKVDLSVRVDNATDKLFAQSADIFYPTQVQLGRPRFVQIDLRAHF